MLRHCDEDSGRSSCSAASVGLSPVVDHQDFSGLHHVKRRSHPKTQEAGTNTELKVSNRPRSFVFPSPDDRDPFPSCRLPRHNRKPIFNLFDTPRMGGLTNAHSTLEIATSTQIERPRIHTNAISVTGIDTNDKIKVNQPGLSHFRRGKPVQRAASRLYKAECGFKGADECVGPEFIVRTSQPAKNLDLTVSPNHDKKVITVVLLNGQRVEVFCDPNSIKAGDLFEALVRSEKYEHNFMLGIAVLLEGDFVFLPDDYKLKKIASEGWHKSSSKKKIVNDVSLTVFLRIKFFLPTNIAKNIQGGDWRHRVYLQLRRATVEGQLTSTIHNLILLAGYALHIEFGEFSCREHGTADYFLLEHYLPESVINQDMFDVKLRMKKAHESRRGLDRDNAIINFITLAQTFRDYGAHFYSAVWATRDGFCRDIWLSIGPNGVTLYSRNNYSTDETGGNTNRIVLQCLPWHHIQTFYYNKKSLYIIPNTNSGLSKIGIKYKLKMAENKTYFAFWLATLHHKLYLKLYSKEDFINYLSYELSYPLSKDSPRQADCSNYQDSYNLAVRNTAKLKRPIRNRFKIELFGERKINKENEKPSTEELLKKILSPLQNDENLNSSNVQINSSNEMLSTSESSLPGRRHGVKMGTKVFKGISSAERPPQPTISKSYNKYMKSDGDITTTYSDSDDFTYEQRQHCKINSMKLLPERHYNQDLCHTATAYVLESPKVYSDVFNYNTAQNESCLNTTLFERMDNMGYLQGERIFVTATLERNDTNALGLQVAEGSDGNVYIKSITPDGPADLSQKLQAGDQIISVNGQTLLNVKYDKALTMLQSAPRNVELIVLQNASKNNPQENTLLTKNNLGSSKLDILSKSSQSIASALDEVLTDDELLNEEALKTIYALIKITKEKVINKIKDKSRHNTPIRETGNLQKSRSEIQMFEELENGNFSSQDSTPYKRNIEKFNTWRGHFPNTRPKRRPLSLSIPTNVNLPDDYLSENYDDLLFKNRAVSSGQSTLAGTDKTVTSSSSSKNVAVPRNFGLGRKWLGPVRYPVTPCKNNNILADSNSAIEEDVVTKHFVYGAGDSTEGQIFL